MLACILSVMLKTKHMNKLLATLCSNLDLEQEHTALLDERDTSDVWRQFAIFFLVDEEHGVLRFTKPGSLQYKAIQRVADLYIKDCKDADAWKEVTAAAWSAADAAAKAAYAAWAAAKAAYYAASASAADAAANDDAAADAASAVDATTDAAWSAADEAADATNEAAEADHYQRMADKLVELINAAPLKETP